MKIKTLSRYWLIGLLILGVNIVIAKESRICSSDCGSITHTIFVPMTCGQNLYTQYHKLLDPEESNFIFDNDECYKKIALDFDLSATYRYMQTRNGSAIASYLWGNNELIFQGSDSNQRAGNALIAEYFGMGPDTNMIATMKPSLKNQVLDLQLAMASEKAWFQINIPLMWSKWKVNKDCSIPSCVGKLGSGDLDRAELELVYNFTGTPGTDRQGNILVNNTSLVNSNGSDIPAGYIWFDNHYNVSADSSLVGQIIVQEALPSMSTNNVTVEDSGNVTLNYTVLTGGSEINPTAGIANQSIPVGIIPMGVYAPFICDADLNIGVVSLNASVNTVAPVNDIAVALGQGYPFGFFAGRANNNFNFNQCTQFNVADLPMMLGYDFCKNDDYHIGGYIKIVLPTGTKIDKDFLQYVLTPVIGNGHHFELGAGISGHFNYACCDESGWGVYFDGYLNKLFGGWQTRAFDLPNQPMSRYALAFPITGNEFSGYQIQNTEIVSIGDVNTHSGNVNAFRGEFILDGIYALQNWEIGLGYAFAGESAEKFDCDSCGKNNIRVYQDESKMNLPIVGYGIVGQALQNQIGVSIVPDTNGSIDSALINNLVINGGNNINVNFFNLGNTNQVAKIFNGESAAYSYGMPSSIDHDIMYSNDNWSNNRSGLMDKQILNRIFGHIDYVCRDSVWQPEIGILGSIGFSPAQSLTAAYWDLGARFGCVF